jgi:hypothetical protein
MSLTAAPIYEPRDGSWTVYYYYMYIITFINKTQSLNMIQLPRSAILTVRTVIGTSPATKHSLNNRLKRFHPYGDQAILVLIKWERKYIGISMSFFPSSIYFILSIN